jgi:two-component system nitrogen regulation sensor histidine kinase GlnL
MPADTNAASAPAYVNCGELLDALTTGLLVLDAQLRLVYANVGAQDLLALSLRQARGRPVGELFAAPHSLIELLRRSLANAETCAGHEFSLTPKSAVRSARPPALVDITVTPFDSVLTGRQLLLELVDARVRRHVARESELLSRADGSRLMVRQLAHEIRNPLGGLRGAAQLLERELHHEGLREYTTVIISEADRLRDLVDKMLGPTGAPRKQPLNVHEICEHVYQLLRGEAPPGVTIDRDYDPSVPEGRFDRNELIQALLNIARNALQALAGSGRVVLRTRALSHLNIGPARHRLVACVQIEDDGPGVPPDLHQTLFFPLVSARADGTGLGLSVAQEMVARHGGIIEFESRVGHTVFSMLLPLEDAT